jgi:hypothetical protein
MPNHSKEMIGTANLHRGLYVVDSAMSVSNCNSVVNNAFGVWHLRLGHLSKLGLQDLSKQLSFVQCKDTL